MFNAFAATISGTLGAATATRTPTSCGTSSSTASPPADGERYRRGDAGGVVAVDLAALHHEAHLLGDA